jgi:hypothetical protein
MFASRTRPLWTAALLLAGAVATATAKEKPAAAAAAAWQEDFGLATCTLATKGRNAYFVLEPGHQLVLEGGGVRLQITVLNETVDIAGVSTRIVEEKEWEKGQLVEVSRNYYAYCEQTQDVLHFGEDVEVHKAGKLVSRDGTWRVDGKSNRPGLVIPGKPKPGLRYFQEIAPGTTLNRGQVMSLSETCKTAAGTFTRCMKIMGTSGMDAKKREFKYYAPQIGLVRDGALRLVRHGMASTP